MRCHVDGTLLCLWVDDVLGGKKDTVAVWLPESILRACRCAVGRRGPVNRNTNQTPNNKGFDGVGLQVFLAAEEEPPVDQHLHCKKDEII